MDSKKLAVIRLLHDSMEEIEIARADTEISKANKRMLEQCAVKLRDIERSIIRKETNELIHLLEKDANELEVLIVKIDKAFQKLEKLAKHLESATKAIKGLSKVIQATQNINPL